jgi:hypothetical protein
MSSKPSALKWGDACKREDWTYTLRPEVLVSRFEFGQPCVAFPASTSGELNVDPPPIEFGLVQA